MCIGLSLTESLWDRSKKKKKKAGVSTKVFASVKTQKQFLNERKEEINSRAGFWKDL